MGIVGISVLILLISFVLALRSMKDVSFGDEVEKFFRRRKIKGSIVFLKTKWRIILQIRLRRRLLVAQKSRCLHLFHCDQTHLSYQIRCYVRHPIQFR
ncbi:MAG: hypothetical protein UZ22_OP11002000681 [Microgenomates bacterium OLB23]|nr:MAG: hypothetical protein UZ22_OP11002000681 [Microgenomates bacterium OLB23]